MREAADVVGVVVIELVRSGGQTGADQGALFGAACRRVPTCGWAPKGYRTEEGPAPWLADFGLMEADSADYAVRTEMNVRESHATLLVGDRSSRGSAATLTYCERIGRPFLVVGWRPGGPTIPSDAAVAGVLAWIRRHDVKWMNVAGNRESVAPGIFRATAMLVRAVLIADAKGSW